MALYHHFYVRCNPSTDQLISNHIISIVPSFPGKCLTAVIVTLMIIKSNTVQYTTTNKENLPNLPHSTHDKQSQHCLHIRASQDMTCKSRRYPNMAMRAPGGALLASRLLVSHTPSRILAALRTPGLAAMARRGCHVSNGRMTGFALPTSLISAVLDPDVSPAALLVLLNTLLTVALAPAMLNRLRQAVPSPSCCCSCWLPDDDM